MVRLRIPFVVLLLGASLGAASQQSQPQPQQPVFRSGIDVVAVDLLVVDKDGHPIPDLKPEDFTVTVDGKPRRNASVEFLAHYDRFATAPDRTAIPNLRPEDRVMMRAEYSSNTKSPPGRLFVLVVDAGNMTRGGGRGAMEAAGQFVQKLAPNDLVALVSLPAGVTVDFTADRLAIKSALIQIVGGGAIKYLSNVNISLGEVFSLVTGSQPRLWDEAVRMECTWARSESEAENCRATLEADARSKFHTARTSAASSERSLEVLIRRLSIIEGQKHMVFIGQALVTGSSYGYLDGLADLKWLGELAQAARVNMYVVHLDRAFLEAFGVVERFPSRTPLEDARLLNDGIAEIAGQAGGAYFNLTTSFDPTFDRIARETSASYLVAFEPTDVDRDGKSSRTMGSSGMRGARTAAGSPGRRPRSGIARRGSTCSGGGALSPMRRGAKGTWGRWQQQSWACSGCLARRAPRARPSRVSARCCRQRTTALAPPGSRPPLPRGPRAMPSRGSRRSGTSGVMSRSRVLKAPVRAPARPGSSPTKVRS